jgi:hypothetical protein
MGRRQTGLGTPVPMARHLYDMPMHRKRVRLHHFMIYVALCSLLNYKSLLIKIGFDIPWDPGGFIT